MKKKFLLFCALFSSASALYAQTTYKTCAWIIPSAFNTAHRVIRLNENSGVRQDTFPDAGQSGVFGQHWSESCICNAQNEIVFYTDVLERELRGTNGSLPYYSVAYQAPGGAPFGGSPERLESSYTTIIPRPGHDHQFYVLSYGIDRELWRAESRYRIRALRYSIIEADPGAQSGRILAFDQFVYQAEGDSALSPGQHALIRHQNERDWWLISHQYPGNKRNIFLIDENGFRLHRTQFIGKAYAYDHYVYALAVDDYGVDVSMDGEIIASVGYEFPFDYQENETPNAYSFLDLMRFDRCVGRLEMIDQLQQDIRFTSPDGKPRNCPRAYNSIKNAIFSPSGQYLYAINSDDIVQYDLWADDWRASADTVHTLQPDTSQGEYFVTNYDATRSPDGKIYVFHQHYDCEPDANTIWDAKPHNNHYGVVHDPDAKGAACNYEYAGLDLGDFTIWGMVYANHHYDMKGLAFEDLPNVSEDAEICPGESAALARQLSYEHVAYRWEPAAGLDDPLAANPVAAPGETTTYTLFMEGLPESCWPGDTLSRTVTVTVAAPPKLFSEAQTTVCPGEAVRLQTDAAAGWTCRWAPAATLDDPEACQTLARPQTSTTYTLTAEHAECGGFSQAEIAVTVRACGLPPLPTVFSPNGDGINDAWPAIQRADFAAYSLKVFDRWGRQLFSTQNPLDGWDGSANGTSAPEGVYFYRLDATTSGGRQTRKSGNMTLAR